MEGTGNMPLSNDRRKLDQITALLNEPITPAMLRIEILATIKGIEVPAGRKAFVALGMQAGVGRASSYRTWGLLHPDDLDRGEDEETALYHVYGEADLLLYIGISNDFGRRWKDHAKVQPWWGEKRRLTTRWYDSRPEAEDEETAAIRAEKPKYNIAKTARLSLVSP
jgi:predicted GIY-YIG superfamily endonuclease